MTTLHLIRHGETRWNADGRFQGQENPSLTDGGRAQAGAAAAALARTRLDAIYTSDLARAAETAEIIAAAHGVTAIADARLREVHFGDWEGLTLAEAAQCWPEVVAAWRADSLRTRPPGGETLEHLQARAVAAVTDMLARHPEGEVAIVAHGGSLRAIIAWALGTDLSVYRRLRLDNCSITTLRAQEGRLRLLTFNDTCHLRAPAAPTPRQGRGNPCR